VPPIIARLRKLSPYWGDLAEGAGAANFQPSMA